MTASATSRRPNAVLQERVFIPFAHAQVTGDTTSILWTTPAGRAFRVDRVWYNNVTGLAQDATNYFNIKIIHGASTIIANWSTLTGANGTLTADTPVDLVLSATDANLVVPVSTQLKLFLDETGAATLEAGYGIIEGRYL